MTVPFEEDDNDTSIWFLDHSYMEVMYKMFKKVNGESTDGVKIGTSLMADGDSMGLTPPPNVILHGVMGRYGSGSMGSMTLHVNLHVILHVVPRACSPGKDCGLVQHGPQAQGGGPGYQRPCVKVHRRLRGAGAGHLRRRGQCAPCCPVLPCPAMSGSVGALPCTRSGCMLAHAR